MSTATQSTPQSPQRPAFEQPAGEASLGGAASLTAFARDRRIPVETTGKLVVSVTDAASAATVTSSNRLTAWKTVDRSW